MPVRKRSLFGEVCVASGVLSRRGLAECLAIRDREGGPLGEVLRRTGTVPDEVLFPLLARHLGVPFLSLKERGIDPEVIPRVPAAAAAAFRVIPVAASPSGLVVAGADPLDPRMLEGLGLVLRERIRPVLARPEDVEEAIGRYYGVGAETIDRLLSRSSSVQDRDEDADEWDLSDSEASIGRFLDQILGRASREGATDIHIEPCDGRVRVRFRIDGELNDVRVPPSLHRFHEAILIRLKILSRLNIAERRRPQDGRFRRRSAGGEDTDLRVSVLPTVAGEGVVIRLLPASRPPGFADLGLNEDQRRLMEGLITRPHGLVFITGPTGHGKTTTLYAMVAAVDRTRRKVITIEDPVEYRLPGCVQIQVRPSVGLTFAAGLRAILRHDPDVIVVGEVRDRETAEIVVRAALTGHLVFSTLHTNDAASAVTRLLEMGVEPYLVAGAVTCLAAQRLVRLICPFCRPSAEARPGRGCESCRGTGYRGREGIYEFLVMDDEIRALVMERAPAARIRRTALRRGMRPMEEEGLERVCAGRTTKAEVIRVVRSGASGEGTGDG